MKGLEVMVISKSELENENITKRLDSEYFKKAILRNIEDIKNYENGYSKLNKYIRQLTGGATPLGAEYEVAGVPFLRVQNIMQNYFNMDEIVYINHKQDKEIKRSRLKENDVLLTITGVSYGKSAVVPKGLENANINQHSVRISLSKDIDPYFLSTFLNSRYGKLQSDKNIVGVTRPALDYDVIRNFNIPDCSFHFQKQIHSLLSKAETISVNSKKIYHKAEKTLLQKLGLNTFKFDFANTNIKSFQECFVQFDRFDAEYYQPKFDQLREHLLQTGGAIKLGSDLSLNKRGTQPIYTDIQMGIPVLNSKHIRENRIEYSDIRFGILKDTNPELVIRKNDVLINGTGVGTIGRSAVYQRDEPALPDNHVTILRTKNIDPLFLSVQLNSIIGKLQVEKYFKGSSGQIELYPADIDEFIVWKAPTATQQEISAAIEESESLRLKFETILQLAQKAVEIAIEQGEDQAIAYINQNTE